MKQIGQDIQDKLGFKPKQFYRERHVYPKYTCRNACLLYTSDAADE